MRPSKLRLPERTATATRSLASIAPATASSSGPELPMHVVQPYPARANPSVSSGAISPAPSRYAVTTREPGASDVLTVGSTNSPRATAFRARRPAPTMTVGLEVFVHEVMAAIATDPVRTVADRPPTVISIGRYARPSIGSELATTGWTTDDASVVAPSRAYEGGSDAGNDPAEASSTTPSPSIGGSLA